MDLEKKIEILSAGAKYDASCSSSGSDRAGGNGAAHQSGICHSWSADGRCISLLKILMTNSCVYDCAYCVNRRSSDIPRAALTPDEIASLTFEFYRRNYIEGLFLSSGVIISPDHTMELMLEALRKLRGENNFTGYIHMKIIPGASRELVDQAGLYADRVSVNIELPTAASLGRLGVVMKRAVYFVTAGGRYGGLRKNSAEAIKTRLLEKKEPAAAAQPALFGAQVRAGEL